MNDLLNIYWKITLALIIATASMAIVALSWAVMLR